MQFVASGQGKSFKEVHLITGSRGSETRTRAPVNNEEARLYERAEPGFGAAARRRRHKSESPPTAPRYYSRVDGVDDERGVAEYIGKKKETDVASTRSKRSLSANDNRAKSLA